MVAMVKLTALFGHPEDSEAFEEYYANQHLPLAAKIPNVQRFESGRVGTVDDGKLPYHRIAELWFGSAERRGEAPVLTGRGGSERGPLKLRHRRGDVLRLRGRGVGGASFSRAGVTIVPGPVSCGRGSIVVPLRYL